MFNTFLINLITYGTDLVHAYLHTYLHPHPNTYTYISLHYVMLCYVHAKCHFGNRETNVCVCM